jgi:hypothetical protein
VNATAAGESSDRPAEYQSSYRRTALAIPCLLAVAVIFVAGAIAIRRFVDGRDLARALFIETGVTALLLGVILAASFRVHRWTIRQQGVEIRERPRIPLTGLSRRTLVPFPEIAALRNVESGFERLIEITTRDGRRFRLSQAMTGGPRDFARPDPAAELGAFALSIRAAAEKAGHALPSASEGLGFWNTAVGLAFLTTLFVISVLIAGVVAWALWSGMTTSPRPRGGEAIAILLLLPVGAGYLLLKSWRRRAAVRASPATPRGG